MQKKLAILVLVILTAVCMLTACAGKTVAKLEFVDFVNEYMQNSTIDHGATKVKVIYDDGTNETKTLTEWKNSRQDVSWTTVDSTKVGKATFKVVFGAVELSQDVNITASYLDEGSRVSAFAEPASITRYRSQSSVQTQTDATFSILNRPYEVGNANKFIVEPTLSALNTAGDRLTQTANVPTTISLKMGESTDSLAEVSADEIATYVVKTGNAYQFTKESANKLFELTISLDNTNNYYTVPSTISASFKLLLTVVDNGYNVYDQTGLSVMNDATDYKYWNSIWKADLSADGKTLVERDDSVILPADDQPLFKYVGQVDWIVMHGDITLNADLLPSEFFYLDKSASDYNGALSTLAGSDPELKMAEELYGSLKDGYGTESGSQNMYISSLGYDTNNNKGFYQTTRVNVSGNYFTIIVPGERSQTGRLLKTVACNGSVGNSNYPYSQWNVFKQMEKTNKGEPVTDFLNKNLGMFGNTGHNETAGPQGIVMMTFYGKSITVDNVVGQGFYQNFSADNYGSQAVTQMALNIVNSKITNSYNAMAYSWRCLINVENSICRNAGGPLFILGDGNGRTADYTTNYPTLNVDDKSILEAYAVGNESWYRQLGEQVPLMFGMVKSIDQYLKPVSGRSYIKPVENKGDYINVIAIVIPETGQAFGSSEWASTGKIINAVVNKVTQGDDNQKVYTPIFDTRQCATQFIGQSGLNFANLAKVSPLYPDPTNNALFASIDLQLTTMLYKDVEPLKTALGAIGQPSGMSTVTIQSGGNIAMVGGVSVSEQGMAATSINYPIALVAGLSDLFGASAEQKAMLNQMVEAAGPSWKATSNEFVSFTLQASTNDPQSPFLSVIVGGNNVVEAQ